MIDRSDYDTETLEALLTLCEAQADNLKVEMTLDDGTPARVVVPLRTRRRGAVGKHGEPGDVFGRTLGHRVAMER